MTDSERLEHWRARLCAALRLPDDDGWEPIVHYVEVQARLNARLLLRIEGLEHEAQVIKRIREILGG